MSEENTSREANAEKRRGLANKLGAVGWALFFIWLGVALLANVGFGAGLLGVGVITLGTQGARRLCGLSLEGLWVVIGLLFVVGGLGEMTGVRLPLAPIVLVVAGLAVLFSVFKAKQSESR